MALNTDNRPIIGYNTVFDLDRGSPVFNSVLGTIFDFNPHNYASMTSSSKITINLDSEASVNYFAIRGFFGSGGADAVLSGSDDGSTYTEIGRIELSSADQCHFMLLSQTETYGHYQLTVEASTLAFISVCYAGMALEVPNPVGIGAALPTYDDQTRYQSNTSVNGGFLGFTVKPAFYRAKINFKYVSKSWVDNSIPYLFDAMRRRPIFYAWNYDQAPNELLFCWQRSKLDAPSYTHNTMLSLSIDVEGMR